MSWPWSQLGLPGPSDLSQVRRAYAEKLKTTHPEDDPEGFQRLHSAYQLASRMARQRKRQEEAPPPEIQTERPAPPEQPPEGEEDFDFDALLQEGGTPPQPREQDRERDKEQDFDFERLFAEGEAERAEERRRRGEERRRQAEERQRALERERLRQEQTRRGAYEQERRDRFDQEQFRWQNTETVLHTIDMLCNSRADRAAWEKFFQSGVFQQTKGSLDLIFGLEDFVSTRQDLSRNARVALFLAYGFDKGVSRPELRPLYQMLLPAWQAERGEKYRNNMGLFWGAVIGIALVPGSMLILTSNWLLVFILLGVLFVIGLKKGWFKRGPEALRKRKPYLGLIAVIAVCLAAGMFLLFKPELQKGLGRLSDPREQVCRYLEKDFGVPFQSIYNQTEREVHANVFAPKDDVGKMFLAGPAGERDKESGERGYTTNYPDMMALWALEEFSEEQGIDGVQAVNTEQGLEEWETTGVYLYILPPRGAGEKITALGEFLEGLLQEDWYRELPPCFEIILCGSRTEEGWPIISRWQSEDGPFDAQEARRMYEESYS